MGKLLIIDFWATWCSPCLEATPSFKKLEAKYENDKVEFITVAIDGEFAYWKKYVEENKWATNNYWLGMQEAQPFFSFMYSEQEIENEKMILVAHPKYVIISPDGKIINNQAASPTKEEFETELKLLIEKYAS